jgi:gliding motility-associated-like protein
MKKTTLWLFIMLVFSVGISYGQSFVENFENGIPADWAKFTLLNNAPGTVPAWENTTGASCEGAKGAFVSNALIGINNTSAAWLVTTRKLIPANADISFLGVQTYPAQNGSIYELWVSPTSQTDLSTFTKVKSWTENEMNPGNQLSCYRQTVSLNAYANQNLYIAFVKRDTQYANVLQGDRFTLDDVRLIGNCLPPTSATTSGITSSYADVAIVGSTPGNWDINVIPGTSAANTNIVTHTGTTSPVRLTGLTPSTPYTYYVRANCGDLNSNWIGPYNFTTLQAATGMPFADDFESGTVGWSFTNGTQINKWFVGNATNNGGQRSMYISDNSAGTTNNYTITQTAVVHAYRDINVSSAATNVGISFDWKGVGELNDYVNVWVVPTTYTPVAGTNIFAATGRVKVGPSFYNSSNFQNYSFMFDATAYRGQTMRLVFEWRNNGTLGTQPPAAIDNVEVKEITCPVPTAIAFSAITTNSATIAWTEPGTATSWDVSVLPTGSPFPASGATGFATTTTRTYNATGLAASAGYDVYVRSNCSSSNKSFWVKAATTLITGCGIIVAPFRENFNSTSTTKQCWTVVDANADNLRWNLSTTYFMSEGDQGASITKYAAVSTPNGNNDYMISPAIQLNGNQRVKFKYRVVGPTTPAELEVLLSTTGVGIAGFTTVLSPVETISNGVYMEKIIYLAGNTGVVNIALHTPQSNLFGWTLFVDEFVVEEIPACAAPTALTASNLDNTSATLSWTKGYQETQWEIAIQPQNGGVPTGNGTLVSSSTYNATGLNPATLYEYYVRAYCSSTSKSEWVGPFVFNTQVCPAATRCNYKITVTATSGNGTFGSLLVYQNGILVGTVSAQSGLVNSGTVAMCPGIPFTVNWNYATWNLYTQEVLIQDSYDETVYRYIKDVTPPVLPISVPIFSSTGTCTPLPCSKPLNVVSTAITSTSITIDWTATGSATSWEVFAVPTGQAAPTDTSVGTIVTAHPYTIPNLIPGTRYSFYVKSVCNATTKSNWTLEKIYQTNITNDNCETAYVLPVSDLGYCTTPYRATLNGATASPQANVCGTAAWANDDVWFEFTAKATSHIMYINNVTGTNTNPLFLNLAKVLYSGSCSTLQQVRCMQGTVNIGYNTVAFISDVTNNTNDVLLTNLTVGTTYKLRIFSAKAVVSDYSFDICIATPAKSVTVDQTTYTPEQLISDVLVNQNCAQVSNINYFTGTNYGAPHNGIGYFDKNGSAFPFNNGILLSTGKASSAVGPKTSMQSAAYTQTVSPYAEQWLGDTTLFDYLNASGLNPNAYKLYNSSSIEFDFMAYGSQMSFNFLFSSEDYGYSQCRESDAFAFFLTDADGKTVNLAVLPGTNIPVSVGTTRDRKYNYGTDTCNSSDNPQIFDELYDGYKGVSRYASTNNFMGNTVPLKVQSAVVPGALYHIKMVVGELKDGLFDSAVFLDGKSFDVGKIDFGTDLLVSTNTAVCFATNKVLDTKLNTTYFNFVWTKDGAVINGATSPTYTVTEPGEYAVVATVKTTGCTASSDIKIEFYDNLGNVVNPAADLSLCTTGTDASFDLTQNTATILNNVTGAANYNVSYFETDALATAGDTTTAIQTPAAYTSVNDKVIYVRVANTVTGCFVIQSFKTIVTLSTKAVVEFSYPTDVCLLSTVNPTPTKVTGFTAGGKFSAADANITVDATTGVIDLSKTVAGTYDVVYTVATLGCRAGDVYSAKVTVKAGTDAVVTFSFADVCLNAANPKPLLSTGFTIGGTFSSADATVDPITGEVDLTTSTVGTHEITYTFAEDTANCIKAGSFKANIVIMNASSTAVIAFSYANDICILSTQNPLPVKAAGFAEGGTFTAANTSVVIDDTTGAIDLSRTPAGSYEIVYTLATANCVQGGSYPFTVVINPATAAAVTFSYTNTCVNATANPLPVGTITLGGTFSSPTVTVNPQTGEVNLSTATIGTHQITYTVADNVTTCTSGDSFTANLVIVNSVAAVTGFTYELNYCAGAGTVLPDLATGFTLGGDFTSTTGLDIEVASGAVNVSNSQPGTYVIMYTYVATDDCDQDGTSTFTIIIADEFAINIAGGCDNNAYVLIASPVDNSYNAASVTYTWKNAQGAVVGNNSATFNVTEYYRKETNIDFPETFTVTVDTDDCSATKSYEVLNILCNVQRGISPNGDGANDDFDLRGMNVAKISIFNRYGKEVYSKNNYTNEWHGQGSNGDTLDTGTYFYSLEIRDGSPKTGWIYINRQN